MNVSLQAACRDDKIQKMLHTQQQIIDEKINVHLTFQPFLVSNQKYENDKNLTQKEIVDALHSSKNKMEIRRREMENLSRSQRNENFTFSPKINKMSEVLSGKSRIEREIFQGFLDENLKNSARIGLLAKHENKGEKYGNERRRESDSEIDRHEYYSKFNENVPYGINDYDSDSGNDLHRSVDNDDYDEECKEHGNKKADYSNYFQSDSDDDDDDDYRSNKSSKITNHNTQNSENKINTKYGRNRKVPHFLNSKVDTGSTGFLNPNDNSKIFFKSISSPSRKNKVDNNTERKQMNVINAHSIHGLKGDSVKSIESTNEKTKKNCFTNREKFLDLNSMKSSGSTDDLMSNKISTSVLISGENTNLGHSRTIYGNVRHDNDNDKNSDSDNNCDVEYKCDHVGDDRDSRMNYVDNNCNSLGSNLVRNKNNSSSSSSSNLRYDDNGDDDDYIKININDSDYVNYYCNNDNNDYIGINNNNGSIQNDDYDRHNPNYTEYSGGDGHNDHRHNGGNNRYSNESKSGSNTRGSQGDYFYRVNDDDDYDHDGNQYDSNSNADISESRDREGNRETPKYTVFEALFQDQFRREIVQNRARLKHYEGNSSYNGDKTKLIMSEKEKKGLYNRLYDDRISIEKKKKYTSKKAFESETEGDEKRRTLSRQESEDLFIR